MKSTAKAMSWVRDLKDRLALRLQSGTTVNTIREQHDAQGWPMLFISVDGVETATDPVIAIRIKADDAVSKDVFGNDLLAFTPHTMEVAYEEAVPSLIDLSVVECELFHMGIKVAVKEIAAATAVTEASINAAAVAIVIPADVLAPAKGM